MPTAKLTSENPLTYEIDGVGQTANVWSCIAHNPAHSGEYIILDGKKFIVRNNISIDPHNCTEWMP